MISFIMMKLLDLINQLNKGSAGESSYNDFGLSLLPGRAFQAWEGFNSARLQGLLSADSAVVSHRAASVIT